MNKIVDFITGSNTIKVNSKEELNQLKKICKDKFDLEINFTWEQVKENPKFANGICVEFQYGKGITYYTSEQESIDWYGEYPIQLKEII